MRQTKITKAFQRERKDQNDVDNELETEVKELQNILQTKQTYLFQLQRASVKRKQHPKKKSERVKKTLKPESIVLESQENSLNEKIWLYTVTAGLEVNSWEDKNKCCIIYHIHHDADHTIRHAINIDMSEDSNCISRYSLPEGLRLNEIISQHSDVLEEAFIMAVQQALLAYYDRLYQCKKLESAIPVGVKTFKNLDATDLEITLKVVSTERPADDPLKIMVNLVYGINHTMPTEVEVICREMSTDTKLILMEQCELFKEKRLHEAFDWCFMSERYGYQCLYTKAPESTVDAAANADEEGYSSDDNSDTDSLRTALLSSSRAPR